MTASFFLYWNRDDRDEHCCVCVYETDPEYSSDTGGHLWNDAGICMVYILGHLFLFFFIITFRFC